MSTNLLTTNSLNVALVEQFANSIASGNSSYYVFAAKHVPYATTDQVVPEPLESDVDSIYDDMLFGKKISIMDTAISATRHDWIANTSYTMYDNLDAELNVKNYYACVNAGSFFNVYKCLYNNNTVSLVEPSGTDVEPFMTPTDGYVWKYMYTANDSVFGKYSSNEYMPVFANTSVQASAVPGAIDIIKIEDSGLGYDNYFTGSFESLSDIKVGGDAYKYGLSATASSVDNFYNNCVIKMTSGSAKGEYKLITDYYVSGGQRVLVLKDAFVNSVVPTDTFEIYPYVFVYDIRNSATVNCDARAIVSTSGNTISFVDVLNPGAGYLGATSVIKADPSVPVRVTAELRAILPPASGHGGDPVSELNASVLAVTQKFVEGETPFPTANDFRMVGVIQDPKFANVNVKIDYTQTIGSFIAGEDVYAYVPVVMKGTANTYSNTHVIGANTRFSESVRTGDVVLVSDGTNNILSSVAAISNNTVLELANAATFTSSNCIVSFVKDLRKFGTVVNINTADITLSNAHSIGSVSTLSFFGATSQTTALANSTSADVVTINGRSDQTFNKFVQLSSFVGTLSNTALIEDETLTQPSSDSYAKPTATFHSVVANPGGPNDIIYVSNVKNPFVPASLANSGVVIGSDSGSQFILSDKYNGDLNVDSGNVLYLETLSPITRANNKTESFKIFIKFD